MPSLRDLTPDALGELRARLISLRKASTSPLASWFEANAERLSLDVADGDRAKARTSPKDPSGEVFYIHADERRDAELAANRRGWPVREVGSFTALVRQVAISSASTMLFALDRERHAPEALREIGRVCARARKSSAIGFLIKAIEERPLRQADSPGDRCVHYTSSMGVPIYGGSLVGDAPDEDASDLLERLSLARGGMILDAHGDGVDVHLGRAVLCSRMSAEVDESWGLGAPPCFRGGRCNFEDEGASRFGAGQIRSRMVFLGTCGGVLSPHGLIDGSLSAGWRMLQKSPNLAALITSVRAVASPPDILQRVYFMMADGLSAGRIANRLNQLYLDAGFDAEWLCFGDPEASLGGRIEQVQAARRESGASIRLDGATKMRDVKLSVQEDLSDCMVLARNQGRFAAGAVEGRAVYVALNPGPRALLDLLRIRGDVLRRAMPSISHLTEDCVVLREYVGELNRRGYDCEQLKRSVDSLGGALSAMSIGDLVGRVVDAGAVAVALEQTWAVLRRVCADVADALGEVFLRGGFYWHLHYWEEISRASREVAVEGRCVGCGHVIKEVRAVVHLTAVERGTGYCDACGPLYVGRPADLEPLCVSRTVQENGLMRVVARLRNPYGFPVPVEGVCLLEGGGEKEMARLDPTVLDTDSACEMSSALPLRFEASPGLYTVSVAVGIGASMMACRAPVLLE